MKNGDKTKVLTCNIKNEDQIGAQARTSVGNNNDYMTTKVCVIKVYLHFGITENDPCQQCGSTFYYTPM